MANPNPLPATVAAMMARGVSQHKAIASAGLGGPTVEKKGK